RGPVRLLLERAVRAPMAQQLRHEVPAADACGVHARALEREDRALELAGVVQLREMRTRVVDRRSPPAADVERIAAGRLEADHGPSGQQLAGGLTRPAAESAV